MKTTRPDTKRELLKLSRRNGESIKQLLSDPASYSDRKVSIPERLTPAAVQRLTKLERLATQFDKSLRR